MRPSVIACGVLLLLPSAARYAPGSSPPNIVIRLADGDFDRSYWFEDWDRCFSPATAALHHVRPWTRDTRIPPA